MNKWNLYNVIKQSYPDTSNSVEWKYDIFSNEKLHAFQVNIPWTDNFEKNIWVYLLLIPIFC